MSSLYHLDEKTGMIYPCDTNVCCGGHHFCSYGAAYREFDAILWARFFLDETTGDENLDEALKKAVAPGFVKVKKDDFFADDQLSVLTTNLGRKFVKEKLDKCVSPKYYETHIWLSGGTANMDDVLTVASEMWLFSHSPYHRFAKIVSNLNNFDKNKTKGYVYQSDHSMETFDNTVFEDALNIFVSDLPDDVVAFDVETDSSQGLGLQPHRTQITDIAVSTKERSWLFTGDEKKVLEGFRNLLDALPERMVVAGWNNHCFDDILIQTRAQFHQIKGWKGVLKPTNNFTQYEPVSFSGEACSLVWDGRCETVDIFQKKCEMDQIDFNVGLKDFVGGLGCSPIVVDRTKMHILTLDEKNAYVISDSLSTLRSFGEVFTV